MMVMNYPALFSKAWKNIWKSIYLWFFAAIITIGSILAFLKLPGLISLISLIVQYLCTLVGTACLVRTVYEIEQNNKSNIKSILGNTKPLLWRIFLVHLITFSMALLLIAPLSYWLFKLSTDAPDNIHIALWFTASTIIVFFVFGVLSFFPVPNVIIRESSVGYALRHGLRTLIGNYKPVAVISILFWMISLLEIILPALVVFYSAGGSTHNLNSVSIFSSYLYFTRTNLGSLILIAITFFLMPFEASLSTMVYLEIAK
jgi:hypothetical protein